MLILFTLTLFVSAALVFWVQLMVAKLLLPLLGGSPAVWNTCMFFFQTMLLLGYGYAHWLTKRCSPRSQPFIHLGLLLLALPLVPIHLTTTPPPVDRPVVWLLGVLLTTVGLPFLAIATTAPLLQRWFAQTAHPLGHDPYFLYAASNAGSLLGLVTYPVLIEPHLSLTQQRVGWAIAYGLLVVLIGACGWCANRAALAIPPSIPSALPSNPTFQPLPPTGGPLTVSQQVRWIWLSFLPSSLVLGVTTYLTTDLAAVPLLWAVPLAIYLLTFILAFAHRVWLPRSLLVVLLPLVSTALILVVLLRIVQPVAVVLPLHLVGLFIAAAVCHGELARTRPEAHHLTLFYLWIAVGGMLGGLFNAIAAPLLFTSILEYPLVLFLTLVLLQASAFKEVQVMGIRLQSVFLLSIGLLLGGLLVGLEGGNASGNLLAIGLNLLALVSLQSAFRLHRLAVWVSSVLLLLLMQFSTVGQQLVLASDRSFFGVYRVLHSGEQFGYHSLLHGTTLHGKQSLAPGRRRQPLTYFTHSGPIGQLFAALESRRISTVGVLGLGVGTLATYAQPGQQWTFYEIDPLARDLALNPQYFTFLTESAVVPRIELGDGRLAIARTPDHTYDLLFMDAFSSDAIPMHLMTQDAIALYGRKLTPHGLLALNITNRYLDLEPTIGAIAHALNLQTLEQHDADVSDGEREAGKAPSHWVILGHSRDDFGPLLTDARWQPIPLQPHLRPWTDDYSNLLQAVRFRKRNMVRS